MKLGDILSVTSEATNVYIHQEGVLVAYYDGKNSIDELYNDYEIITLWTDNKGLNIEIVL